MLKIIKSNIIIKAEIIHFKFKKRSEKHKQN